VTSGVAFRACRRARRVGFSRGPRSFYAARNDADLPGRHLVSEVVLLLLQLAVDRVQIPSRMALAHVPARVRDVFGDIGAVRALESRLLTALKFLMVSKTALVTEDAATVRAGEPLAQRLYARTCPDHRRRRGRRRGRRRCRDC
jgi:hypothetical protein